MDNLILYTLASYGLCHILMYGEILASIRSKIMQYRIISDLLNCALCTGFWTGAIISSFTPYNIFIFSLYSAAVCFILHLATEIMLKKAYSKDAEQTSLDFQVDE